MTETSQDLEDKLAGVPIFSGLSRRQVKKVLDKSKTVEHQAGHAIAVEGEGALALHLILSGTASVTMHGKPVRELHEGDYFGDISLIDGKRRSATVTATSALSALAVPHLVFQKLLDEDSDFARGLLVLLCTRLREAEQAPSPSA